MRSGVDFPPLEGPSLDGEAEVVDEAEEDDIFSGLRRREGVTGGLNSCGGKGGESVGRSRDPGPDRGR